MDLSPFFLATIHLLAFRTELIQFQTPPPPLSKTISVINVKGARLFTIAADSCQSSVIKTLLVAAGNGNSWFNNVRYGTWMSSAVSVR